MSARDRHVTELKIWAERIRRAEAQGLRGRLRAVRRAAAAPASFVRAASRALGEYGDEVAGRHGIARASQLAGMLLCRLRWGLDPIAYYRFCLYLRDRSLRAASYLQTADVGRTLEWLVHATPGYPAVFRDKRAFDRWCTEHGLPSVPSLAEFEDGIVAVGDPGGLPGVDLFSKPSNWQSGRGVQRWMVDPARAAWLDAAGRALTGRELFAHLASESAVLGRPMLLQRLLRNHRAIDPLAPGRLCTARVLTVRGPGERARPLLAVYRMPVAPAIADNFDLGGIAAPIDLATGRLGAGIRKYPRVSDALERHPDSGEPLRGVRIPHWPAIVELAVRAHDAVGWPGVPVVGWDVAVLDEGPVLLEGNNRPCVTLAQMPSGMPLGATPFAACINAHVRERWGTATPAGDERGPQVAGRAIASPEAPPPAACR
jgi:hypothetical protein